MKKSLSPQLFFPWVVLSLVALSILIYALYQCESEKNSISEDHAKIQVLNALRDFEKGFMRWNLKGRKAVREVAQEPMVQKLIRPKIRKRFARDRRSDWQNLSKRFSVYTVRNSKGQLKVRPVFEDYRPRLLWEKVLEMLASRALEISGELNSGANGGSTKMQELAALVLKGTGLSKIQEPASFTSLDLLGEQTLFYWDILYRRCPQKIRMNKGLVRCVKGLFLAELSPRLMLRDYWEQKIPHSENFFYSIIFSNSMVFSNESRSKPSVEALFPWTLHSSFPYAKALGNLGSLGLPEFFEDQDSLCIVAPLKAVKGAFIGTCLKPSFSS
jgi:hypothetical protein